MKVLTEMFISGISGIEENNWTLWNSYNNSIISKYGYAILHYLYIDKV